jgi:hypothetical protein
MRTLLAAALALIGMAVVFRSRQLSERYNAWTTKVRQRNPRMNIPPTPEMLALNTKIMTGLIGFLGAGLVIIAFVLFLGPTTSN